MKSRFRLSSIFSSRRLGLHKFWMRENTARERYLTRSTTPLLGRNSHREPIFSVGCAGWCLRPSDPTPPSAANPDAKSAQLLRLFVHHGRPILNLPRCNPCGCPSSNVVGTQNAQVQGFLARAQKNPSPKRPHGRAREFFFY
jgi:hypothetical protein